MEATKFLKPLVKLAMNWWHRECAGRNAVSARANLEKGDAQATRTPYRVKLTSLAA